MNKALNIVGFLLIVAFFSTFIILVFSYPDAPIRTCGEGLYCGRGGQSYSRQDHDDFWFLGYSLAGMFVLGALSLAIANRSRIFGGTR
jgi:hypothetical protein